MSWNFLEPAGRKSLHEAWRREAEDLFALVSDVDLWEQPTAAGHWLVRDVIAHMIDNTEMYLRSFEAARGGPDMGEPWAVRDMARHMDEGAKRLRDQPREVLLARLHNAQDRILQESTDLTDKQWTEHLVPHKFMGSVPACFLPICQLLDYAVHAWDIRQGTGRAHNLDGRTADLLVPVCFLMWQNTVTSTDGEPLRIGIRVTSGENAGDTVATLGPDGVQFEPGDVTGLPTVLEFDPASLVLAAFGRANTGTCRGDRALADRFLNLFFRV
ncbi:maleylpyruvate isomerase family mycothiol-dependent enzyme [Pseudonocardiaceae bacterium YIM PH 21723]|nr:maleylpyruvate isomerase family mycothiol-dependent enzyme [Pseudonocardiaceae bacterium YIM PH 21723]